MGETQYIDADTHCKCVDIYEARIAELEQRIKNVVRFVSDTSYLSSNKINRIIAIAEGRE